ncbi:hypothetical protein MELA_00008 [Candidatus Methylomirabilis lanthanidiphila]|uniref:General secretion pathway GspH domain-containing protein n=1 Tax=Candidatus Methylomirabilis lanthanidiphila TaxID=2211376 RepID=A0A564ZEA8_9BACT|nr:GspH/FimT family pseudopilin [Candidatus Methylomirabilis lanthanidiphila]VUZ83655.1 hypothetical protein MELA_00008 [Candidatus Methylomirabilis lanthanidiphila]
MLERVLSNSRGLTIAELLVTIGIIGIVSVTAFPVFVNFLQATQTRGAARELVDLLNQARQLAIATNSRYQVEIDTANNRLRFVRTNNGQPWIEPGTDGQGYRRLENQARLSNTNRPAFAFNPLGTTPDTGTITVQDSSGHSSLGVVVSTTGRIRICPPNCP